MQTGSCHCGAVKFTAQGEIDKAIECNCSICSGKGLLLWFAPLEAFAITQGEDKLTTYTFNKHVIQHHFCSICGSETFGKGTRPDGAKMAAINVRFVDGIDLVGLKRVPFNGKDL